jgi:hypothetical protein
MEHVSQGPRHFWIYWVVAIAIIVGVFFIPLSQETITWVLSTLLRVKGLVKLYRRGSRGGKETNVPFQDYNVRDGILLWRKPRPTVTGTELPRLVST